MFGGSPDLLNLFRNDAHTLFNTLLIPDGNLPHGPDTFLDKLGIDLIHVFFKLFQDHFIVLIVDDAGEYFYFFILYVVGVSEFGEEALDIILEDRGALLYDVLNVFEDHVLHLFGGEGYYGDD
jgi:hypothetical protein